MMRTLALLLSCGLALPLGAGPSDDAGRYAAAIDGINAAHARDPGDTTEDALADELPKRAVSALERVLKAKPSGETVKALLKCGEAALDLALMEHFADIRARLLETDPAAAATLGRALARERFLVRGIGDLEDGYLEDFAELTEGVLEAYDEVFGFEEWSKVPGKKIRIRVHLVDRITRPPHFAPQFPYHSEIDMPVINAEEFRSPTPKGQMMFYGLCHELGHLIAMWGDRRTEEDHHAWAHYTGVVIVEHMANAPKYRELLQNRRDVRWRSLTLERKKAAEGEGSSFEDRAGVLSFLIDLHEAAGPKTIGAAFNHMDKEKAGHRINHVRYYSFADLKKALGEVMEEGERKAAVLELFN